MRYLFNPLAEKEVILKPEDFPYRIVHKFPELWNSYKLKNIRVVIEGITLENISHLFNHIREISDDEYITESDYIIQISTDESPIDITKNYNRFIDKSVCNIDTSKLDAFTMKSYIRPKKVELPIKEAARINQYYTNLVFKISKESPHLLYAGFTSCLLSKLVENYGSSILLEDTEDIINLLLERGYPLIAHHFFLLTHEEKLKETYYGTRIREDISRVLSNKTNPLRTYYFGRSSVKEFNKLFGTKLKVREEIDLRESL